MENKKLKCGKPRNNELCLSFKVLNENKFCLKYILSMYLYNFKDEYFTVELIFN